MRYSFTGTRFVPPGGHDHLDEVVRELATRHGAGHGVSFTTGGCRGVDHGIGWRLAAALPAAHHLIVVPANRSQVDPWWRYAPGPWLEQRHLTVITMPPGSTYRDRNERVVDLGRDELWALPRYPEHDARSRRSGTWMTVRIARGHGVPVVERLVAPCPA